jgi:hypothetical protein
MVNQIFPKGYKSWTEYYQKKDSISTKKTIFYIAIVVLAYAFNAYIDTTILL